jgi:alpha-L-fucosidase
VQRISETNWFAGVMSPVLPLTLTLVAGMLSGCASASNTTGAEGDDPGNEAATPEVETIQARPEMEWWRKSMEDRDKRIGWFRDGRFGMFVHWGAYSHVGGIWNGQAVEGYAEHLMRKQKIPTKVYQEKVVAPFNPTEFNAEEWMAAAKRAGMTYFIITAKHHDGFAMYDSDVSDYNVVKASAWKRDPMKELKEAAKRNGIKFGFYYSQAWEWHPPDSPGNDWEGGDRLPATGRWWEGKPERVAKVRRYVDGKVIPQVKELIAKYDPDIMWFDTPGRLPPEENIKVLKAVREAKPSIVVNSRICQPVPNGPPANFGDYASTADKPAEFPPHDGEWEAIPTTNESYGWHQGDLTHKPPSHFIDLLAKAAARGGNVLLNIGPMGNGKIEPKDLAILDGIGAWMTTNGEAIKGTQRTPLPVQAWGESTRKGNNLYLHVLDWPKKGRVVVGGLKTGVKKAYLLSDPKRAPLPVEKLGELDVAVQGPAKAPDKVDAVIALELEGAPAADKDRLLSSDVQTDVLRALDAKISGGLEFGQGKKENAYIENWRATSDSVWWPARVREAVTYEVAIGYASNPKSVGGTFVVRVGNKVLPGTVAETPKAPVVLGRVTLDPGKLHIAVEASKIVGAELFRLRGLTFTPVPSTVSSLDEAPSQAASEAPKRKRRR